MSSFFETSPFSSSLKHTSAHASASASARVVPAQVNFLTIYNPSLGDTEETEGDQIVFWGSKNTLLAARGRVGGRNRKTRDERTAHGSIKPNDTADGDAHQHKVERVEDLNYKLRQIGLARGMVDFAKNFSNDKPLSSIETQTSRIILHELEQGWWVLANIDLTRLPASVPSSQTQPTAPKSKKENANHEGHGKKNKAETEVYEYSAREVAPPQLLLAQILRAHQTFLLHHATTLWELYNRLGNARFTAHLRKFWDRFMWDWDVLLHGNPAVDVYGICTKLAGGGELGMGVGEEEWGSGEREVLEGFVSRTEGCLDLIVGRYGDAPTTKKGQKRDYLVSEDESEEQNSDQDWWLGNGDDPGPADGVVFSGVGSLSRKSLASVSQWMESIFKYGEDAYGVGENPSARPRQKRRCQRPTTTRKVSDDPRNLNKRQSSTSDNDSQDTQGFQGRFRSPKNKSSDLRRKAIENSALPPGIPAPLVSSVERSLDEAIAKASQRANSKSPRSSPTQEKSEDEVMKLRGNDQSDATDSWFDTDKMAKVFKFGYGTSWTLNPQGFADQKDESLKKVEPTQEDLLLPEETTAQPADALAIRPRLQRTPSKPAEERLQEIDPTPEVSDEAESPSKPFLQHLEKSIGRFLIGLSGDLENNEFEDDDDDDDNDSPDLDAPQATKHQRLFLRTLNVQLGRAEHRGSIASLESSTSHKSSTKSQNSNGGGPEPKTSAAASIDGPTQPSTQHQKVQVAVYVHQPFIFVFLFSLHTPSLTMPGFYRGIHHQLGPLQVPLLKRTDPERVAKRIKDAMFSHTNDDKYRSDGSPSQLEQVAGGQGNTVYDLVYDSTKLTIRTSIPNIPIPTSLLDPSPTKNTTVSGSWYTLGIPIGSTASTPSPSRSASSQRNLGNTQAEKVRAEQWVRIDALNVHQQILNSYAATHSDFASSTPATMASTSKSAYANTSAVPSASLLKDTELERTIKTNRGWWVLWMRVPGSSATMENQPGTPTRSSRANSNSDQARISKSTLRTLIAHHDDKEAFLVRKSADTLPVKSSIKSGTSSPMSGGRWLLREQPKDSHRSSGGSTHFSGASNSITTRNVSEGVGIDARKWVEGLLSLTS